MAENQLASQIENSSTTITLHNDEADGNAQPDVATVRLKLRKPKSSKKVNWTEETIDNENMDKKKSKCCCIYKKPRAPDESSSDDSDDECEHCQGHVDKNKQGSKGQPSGPSESHSQSIIAA